VSDRSVRAGASLLAILTVLVVAACTTGRAPAPDEPASIPTPTPRLSRIDKPLDARGVVACGLLPQPQLEAIGIDSATATDHSNENASSCRWRTADGSGAMSFVLNVNQALSLITQGRDGMQGYLEFALRGYPAIRENSPRESSCAVYVGIAESQVFVIDFTTRSSDESVRACDVAQRGAEAVIDSLSSRS